MTPPPTTTFADLILPVPIPKLLTYRVPAAHATTIAPGSRVIAPLGPKKILTGIVHKVHTTPPDYATKDVLEVLDDAPVVQPLQLKFFHWLAHYYLCTAGEVMQLALPTGLKLSSQSKIQLNPDFDLTAATLSDQEGQLVQALRQRPDLTYEEAAAVVGRKSAHKPIKSLLHRRAILLFEEVKEKYTPKRVQQVRLSEAYTQEEAAFKALFAQLEKHDKQLDVLLKYLAQAPVRPGKRAEEYWIDKKALLQAEVSSSALQTLLKKGIFVTQATVVSRFGHLEATNHPPPTLSAAQSAALEAIHQQWQDKATVLLHGVTGSGKTEVYVQLIQSVLQSGGQVLYLLPEIALTTQMVKRLKKIFGSQMGVYHSKYANNERVEVWNHVLDDTFSFVLGVRSAIFLPFSNLSLIIVDEEHETSYKQFEGQPRYHARDAALVLAQYHQAKVLLGSATPSVETYYNAQTGKYGLVSLTERFGEAVLPTIEFANVRIARERKAMREDFTQTLLDAVAQALERQEQTIIFQNRRGYAPHITCEDCAWVPMCTQCAVSLTYHQRNNHLRCHYCGHYIPMPPACGLCDSHRLKNVGFGTEKLEETLQLFFPQKTVQRMDLDTTRGKHSYDRLIEGLEQGQTDILVGTQMVTKGLDFGKVSLVGVLGADRLLHFPDFRAAERCFQLVTQVSGRAGRRAQQGRVIIQTANPEHPTLQAIAANDYEQLYARELAERREFLYPPFVRLVRIILKHRDQVLVTAAAQDLAQRLREPLGKRVLGPQAPLVSRIRQQHLLELWIKVSKDPTKAAATKECLRAAGRQLLLDRAFKAVKVVFDVDPV